MRHKFLGSYFLATILVFSLPVYSAAYITNITVNNGKTFQIGNVHAGETVYIDRTYEILAGYPAEFDGLDLIKTACDDKYDSSDNYLSFDVSVPSTIYICFQQTTPPDWLSSMFTKTNKTIPRTYRTYDIWYKNVPAGNVILGGSSAEGTGVINATYFVIIAKQKTDLVVASINTTPFSPAPGEEITVEVTVKNQGIFDADSFSIDWYADLETSPSVYQSGDFYETVSLASGETYTMVFEYVYGSLGDHSMWAQVDTDNNVSESNDNNNILGAQDICVGMTDCSLVSDVSPSNFEIAEVHVGETVYIDRDYEILSGYSPEYEGLDLIKTACDDKYDYSDNYLSFDLSRAATVYVCFEQTTPPNWLSSEFVNTYKIIPRTNRIYDVWEKTFPAGKVILGGSSAEGASVINATYFVIVKENSVINGPPAPLAKTGQIISYAPGDDGAHQKGIPWPDKRFTDNGDGTVTDHLTGLIWLKDADCAGEMNWEDALTFCSNLAIDSCGLTDSSSAGDWRLPNVEELQSLIHYGFYRPALPNTVGTGKWIEDDPFTGVVSSYYWSSSTGADDPPYKWFVSFNYGQVNGDTKDNSNCVWCVRDGEK